MNRFISWGHWGITFWEGTYGGSRATGNRCIAQVSFGVGAQGPVDGFIGSPLRRSYQAACKAWVEHGELPEGACCPLGQEWLYDNDNPAPDAVWREPRGWTSPRRVGRDWGFP